MNLYLVIGLSVVGVAAYLGIHYHIWQIKKHYSGSLSSFDEERTKFLVEKMLHVSQTSMVLSRVCRECRQVVHKYNLFDDGTVVCHDCRK